jgi:hypothetical protein
MKRLPFVFLLTVVMIFTVALSQKAKTDTVRRDEAVVEFPETVKLVNVFLKGQYLMVHDEGKMAEGLPCLYVYSMKNGKAGALVVSFHCQHLEREKVGQFTVKVSARRTPYDVLEVQEIQFAGTADGHGVPK